jgi:hypothetical protein
VTEESQLEPSIDDLAHLLGIGLRGAMRVDQDGRPPHRVRDLDEPTDLVHAERREMLALVLSTEPIVGGVTLGPDLGVERLSPAVLVLVGHELGSVPMTPTAKICRRPLMISASSAGRLASGAKPTMPATPPCGERDGGEDR